MPSTLIQNIANRVFAQNTLIFVVEDDAQDGADHIDSHRTIAFEAGAYAKQAAAVSKPYTPIDFMRVMGGSWSKAMVELEREVSASHDGYFYHHSESVEL